MLNKLFISNYALIESAEVSFNPKLVTITGESGAGKSVMINALALVLGSRADFAAIRAGSEKCVVEAVFSNISHQAKTELVDNALDDFAELILRRELTKTGRSRAFVNDTPVALSVLKSVSQTLLDMYSQHEYAWLNKSDFQAKQLDQYAKATPIFLDFSKKFDAYKSLKVKLESLKAQAAQMRKDADYYQFQFDEIQSTNIDDVNLVELESELATQEGAEEVLKALDRVDKILSGEGGMVDASSDAVTSLSKLDQKIEKVAALTKRIESIKHEINDVGFEVSSLASEIEVNPEMAELLQDKIDAINALLHKHNVTSIEELVEVMSDYEKKLATTADFDKEIERLESSMLELKSELMGLAKNLSVKRQNAIPSFEKTVMEILSEMGMEKAQLKVELLESERYKSIGLKSIKFLFNANNTGDLMPVDKVASGGELARLMLALKVACKGQENQCLVFDEIDTGVSGEVSKRIGSVMLRLSENTQCIAITHLPGVASRGHQHIKISKVEQSEKATTQIQTLSEDERIVELASMFSGNDPTEAALDTARSLRAELN